MSPALDRSFTARLQTSTAPGGWTYVATDWTAEFFGTHGLVKVAETVDGRPFRNLSTSVGQLISAITGCSPRCRWVG